MKREAEVRVALKEETSFLLLASCVRGTTCAEEERVLLRLPARAPAVSVSAIGPAPPPPPLDAGGEVPARRGASE